MNIRIVDVPPGEAPVEVRRAWVGLTLPLALGETGPRPVPVVGVCSGPRTFFGKLWRFLTGCRSRGMQYVVPVDRALEVLEGAAPEAAAWWRKNTPHLVACGRSFGFVAQVCEEIAT